MKNIIVAIVTLFLWDAAGASLVSEELMSQVRALAEREKEKHHLKLSDAEAYAAVQLDLELNSITLETFQPFARQSRKLVEVLRAVAAGRKTSDAAYQEMADFLSPQQWNYYSKNYTTEEKIKKLEEIIPDNMETIIRTGQASFAQLAEEWLLQQYILESSRKADPTRIEIPDEMVLREWWRQRLQESLTIPEDTLEPLLSILSMGSSFNKHAAEWKEFFKEKLAASLSEAAEPQEK